MPAIVPDGDLLVEKDNARQRLLVLDRRGELIRRLPRSVVPGALGGFAIGPDRRHVFGSVFRRGHLPGLYKISLASRNRHKIAPDAISPALSPDNRSLAYLTLSRTSGITYITALVVRDLRTGDSRSIPFGPNVPLGTPPELVINWSLNSKRIAVVDPPHTRIVNVATATDVPSQRAVSGHALAPVFLRPRKLVVLANCCVGRQHLALVRLPSDTRTSFARISSPDETALRLGPRRILVVDALRELALVSRHRVRVIARRVRTAGG